MVAPSIQYQAEIASGILQPDPAQQRLLPLLDSHYAQLTQQPVGWFRGWFRPPKPSLSGMYLYGGVGAGKTCFMDLFFSCIPGERKTRVHFHQFMRELHEALAADKKRKNPLAHWVTTFTKQYDLLCLDEMMVTDIADAMIFERLLAALKDTSLVLFMTSNSHPDALYLDGLHRNRFLPAIATLKKHCQVEKMDTNTDYRLTFSLQQGVYFSPQSGKNRQRFQQLFQQMTPHDCQTQGMLSLYGRQLPFEGRGQGVIWFRFDVLCYPPRSQLDYLRLVETYHTLLLSAVPRLTIGEKDRLIRFIHLVDVLYDARVKLWLLADVSLDKLLPTQEMSACLRTHSRLHEMASEGYLAAPHLTPE